MRTISVIVLLGLIALLVLLGYENNHPATLTAWRWNWEVPFPIMIAGVYVLGMLTGWSMIGWTKRSWQRVTERA